MFGRSKSSFTIVLYFTKSTFLSLKPTSTASISITTAWHVKALVEATPISGPACIYIPESVSLEIVDPTTLQTPYRNGLNSLANLIAANVSAVSPDCETGIIISSWFIIGFLYLNSEAYSTSTGILANSSK